MEKTKLVYYWQFSVNSLSVVESLIETSELQKIVLLMSYLNNNTTNITQHLIKIYYIKKQQQKCDTQVCLKL